MSLDVAGRRLFVSALGNNTVEVVDLKAGKRTNTISGLHEPQGALYVAGKDRLYIASAKDGTVKMFDGTSLRLLKTIEYGNDADHLRYDAARERIYVGFGDGSLGELDIDGQKIAETKLDSHPESFQLEIMSPRIYVNLPKSRKIAVVNREAHSIVTSWGTGLSLANYAMAIDETDHRLFVVTRFPARLLVIDTESGRIIQNSRPLVIATTSFSIRPANRFMPRAAKAPFRYLGNKTPITTGRSFESQRRTGLAPAFSPRSWPGFT